MPASRQPAAPSRRAVPAKVIPSRRTKTRVSGLGAFPEETHEAPRAVRCQSGPEGAAARAVPRAEVN